MINFIVKALMVLVSVGGIISLVYGLYAVYFFKTNKDVVLYEKNGFEE